MNDLATTLETLDRALADVVSGAFGDAAAAAQNDDRLVAVIAAAAAISRHAEALLIEGAAEVADRSSAPSLSERMTARRGCHNVAELMQRVTRMSSRSVSDLIAAGSAVHRSVAPSSGELLPPEFPAMRSALAAGAVGVDGLLAAVRPLTGIVANVGRAPHLAADEELAAAARGEGVDAAPPACADDERCVWTL